MTNRFIYQRITFHFKRMSFYIIYFISTISAVLFFIFIEIMLFWRATIVLWLIRVTECFISEAQVDGEVQGEDLLSNAVRNLVLEVCHRSELDIILASDDDALNDIASNLIAGLGIPVLIERKIKVLSHRKRLFVLILMKDLEGFEKIYNQMTVDGFYFNGFFIAVFPDGKLHELDKLFALLWKKYIYNINIITQTSGRIEMFTFMPFKRLGKCGDITNVKVNEFDVKSMNWQTKNFFTKKFVNLHQCPIKCGAFKLEPAIIVNHGANGSKHLSGFDVDIFSELLHSVNAVVEFTVYPIDTGKIYPNGSGTGLLGHTINGDVDSSLRSWSLQLDRRKFLSETISYFSDTLMIIMPPPMPLNPLLKFIRPLKLEVWGAIGAIVLIACVVIWMSKLIPKNYYQRIIGKEMRDKFLNILIGFIGSSQNTLPEKNFPRFLLMKFLIFCLIVRSLYLGSLFGMLKTEIRTREFTSIHDFFDAGFEFYVYETLSQRLDYPEINSRYTELLLSFLEPP